MRVRLSVVLRFALLGAVVAATPVVAGQPRIDKDTCTQLVGEQATFIQSGILADLQRGAAWGKSNLSADRLREIEHYIMLDEQIKFGCRQATLTPEMERAGEIAKRLEQNSDADPFAPPPEPKTTEPKTTEPKTTEPKTKEHAAPQSGADANTDDAKPAAKPKAERRAVRVETTPLSDPSHAPAVKPAAKSAGGSEAPVKKGDDALKTPPTHVAPAP